MEVLEAFEHVASPKTVVPAAWVTAAIARHRSGAAEVAVGTSLAVLGADLLKRVVWRWRPHLHPREPGQSFPSGHSAASTAYLMGLAMLAPRPRRHLALGLAAVLAGAVNVCRVAAREHWPSDVVAGDVLGLAGLAMAYVVAPAIMARRERVRLPAPRVPPWDARRAM